MINVFGVGTWKAQKRKAKSLLKEKDENEGEEKEEEIEEEDEAQKPPQRDFRLDLINVF